MKYVIAAKTLMIGGVLLLTACAELEPAYYQKQSSLQLCTDFLTLPSTNITQSYRAEELGRRGENCSAYMAIAAEKRKANAQARPIFNGPPPKVGTYLPPPKSTYQIPPIFSPGVTCTTIGNTTHCN